MPPPSETPSTHSDAIRPDAILDAAPTRMFQNASIPLLANATILRIIPTSTSSNRHGHHRQPTHNSSLGSPSIGSRPVPRPRRLHPRTSSRQLSRPRPPRRPPRLHPSLVLRASRHGPARLHRARDPHRPRRSRNHPHPRRVGGNYAPALLPAQNRRSLPHPPRHVPQPHRPRHRPRSRRRPTGSLRSAPQPRRRAKRALPPAASRAPRLP